MGSWVSSAPSEPAESEPWWLDPSDLESWYNDNIQSGTRSFDIACRQAIDMVVRHLHAACSTNTDLFNVSEVIKVSSLTEMNAFSPSQSDVEQIYSRLMQL